MAEQQEIQDTADNLDIRTRLNEAANYSPNPMRAATRSLESMRDEEMTTKSLADFCKTFGKPAKVGLAEHLGNSDLKVIAVGESEFPRSPIRRFMQGLVSDSVASGITCIALEWRDADQNILDKFCNDGDLDSLAESSRHRELHQDYFDDVRIPDPYYYAILKTAQEGKLHFAAVDESPVKGQPYSGRDRVMANNLDRLVKDGHRILFFGGSKHHYRRAIMHGESRGTLELLSEKIGAAAIFSVVSLVQRDIGNTFRFLAKCCEHFAEPLLVDTTNPRIGSRVACVESRCPNGTCDLLLSDYQLRECFHCKKFGTALGKTGLSPVLFSAWNAALFLPEEDPLPWPRAAE